MLDRIQDTAPGATQTYSAKSALFTAGVGDRGTYFDSTGSFTITLDTTSMSAGWSAWFRTVSGTQTFDPTGATLINGAATYAVSNPGDVVLVEYTGSAFVVSQAQLPAAVAITGGTINNTTIGATTATTGRFTTVQSTVATGTAPLIVASTTVVANLNASLLLGSTWAIPGAIGSTTPTTGAFTTLTTSSTLTVASDTDITTILGRTKVGSPASDQAVFAHFDHLTTTNFALRQDSGGGTTVNVATGQTLEFAVAGTTRFSMTNTGFNVGSNLIANIANTTASTTTGTGALTVAGGVGVAGAITAGGSVSIAQTSANSFIGQGTGWIWTSTGLSSGTTRGGIIASSGGTLSLFGGSTITDHLTIASDGFANFYRTSSSTSSVFGSAFFHHRSTGTPAAGFGTSLNFLLESDTTNDQAAGAINVAWTTATHASRRSYLSFEAYDISTSREGFRISANGSAALIGFLGATPVVRPTSTTDLRQGLIDLGLYTTGGATPLNLNGGALTAGSITHASTTLLTTSVALTNGAAAAAGTLSNAPTAGNPTKWIPINDNGTTRYIPAW